MAGIRVRLATALIAGLLAASALAAAATADAGRRSEADLRVEEIARAIDSTQDPARRLAQIERLRSFSMQAGAAAPALIRAMRAPDKPVRLAALAALYNMAAAAGTASVAPLMAALNDPDAEIRAAAARSFRGLGSWTWQDDPEYGDICRAAQAAQQPLAKIAADPKQPHEVRVEAAAALADMPVEAAMVPELIAALDPPGEDEREQICHALARTKSRAAVPALEALLRDSTAKVQVAAAEALLAAGAGKHAVRRLALILVDRVVEVGTRSKAGYLLEEHPADARPALRELAQVAFMPHEHLIERMPSDGREDVRQWARQAIDRIGAPAVPFILPYVRARSGSDFAREQRNDAIDALCGLGPAAKSAVPALMPLLKSPDTQTRGDVARCLVWNIRVDPKVIGPRVLPLLSDREHWVVREVVRATKFLGPAAAPALPRLRQLARDKDGDVRTDALDTLAAIGAAARPARPEMEAGLTDAEEKVQVAAGLALVKTRIAPDVGVKRLIELLTDRTPRSGDGRPSRMAPWRIGELAALPEGKQVLPALVAALNSAEPGIHDGIAHSIAAFGDEAASTALVPLTKALDRDWYGVSKEACAALATFGPKILPAVPALVKRLAGGNGEPSAAQALLVTARRSPEISAAVRAECARTQGSHLRRCRRLIKEIDEPAPAPAR